MEERLAGCARLDAGGHGEQLARICHDSGLPRAARRPLSDGHRDLDRSDFVLSSHNTSLTEDETARAVTERPGERSWES